MTITTTSKYIVTFKDESDLTYGERREIKRAIVRGMKITQGQGNVPTITGEVAYDMTDAYLKVLLKSIQRPDGNMVEGDLFAEIMTWKNPKDGDEVFEVIEKLQAEQPIIGNEKKNNR